MPVFSLLGLFTGSFLNVCIDRLPREQSIINPPSHCPNCNQKLSVLDLIPIFSYLWLRGKCRYCQASIPLRLPIVEGVTSLLFTFLYWNFGISLELGISLIYGCILIIIFVIDLEHQLVLNVVTYPSIIIALILSIFWTGLDMNSWLQIEELNRIVISLAGGAVGLAAMALPIIIYPKSMGWGDIKLGALIGVMTGYPLIFVVVLLSWISGGTIAAILLALKIKQRKDPIPFATFLAVATMVTLLWGQLIYQWYIY
ncbi:prepilin peptidase [Chloroflexota bacterium]